MVVAALVAVAVGGLQARTRDLGFESRALRRTQARWAAESGIARGAERLSRGVPPEVRGTLKPHSVCDRIAYRVQRTAGHTTTLESIGRCSRAGRKDAEVRIRVSYQKSGTRLRVTDWREALE